MRLVVTSAVLGPRTVSRRSNVPIMAVPQKSRISLRDERSDISWGRSKRQGGNSSRHTWYGGRVSAETLPLTLIDNQRMGQE